MSEAELIDGAAQWTQHTKFEMELQRRANLGQEALTVAIDEFRRSADRSARQLWWATLVLLGLTLVIALLTLQLVIHPPA